MKISTKYCVSRAWESIRQNGEGFFARLLDAAFYIKLKLPGESDADAGDHSFYRVSTFEYPFTN